MYQRKALERELILQGKTKKDMAEVCQVAQQTMLRHFRDGNFSLREVELICRELALTDPRPYFFTGLVT